jgi:hypothetical protein
VFALKKGAIRIGICTESIVPIAREPKLLLSLTRYSPDSFRSYSLHSSLLRPRHLTPNIQPIPFTPLLRTQVLHIHLLRANLREIERLALPTFESLPRANLLPIRPRQRTDPRLHIPPELQHHISPVLQLAANIRDLVFRALIAQVQFAAGVEQVCVFGVVAGLRFGGGLCLLGFLGEDFGFGFRVWVDEVELVPGRGGGGEDGVPDYGFGGGFRGACGGVDGFEVEEDLLGVPAEECGEVWALLVGASQYVGTRELYQRPSRT